MKPEGKELNESLPNVFYVKKFKVKFGEGMYDGPMYIKLELKVVLPEEFRHDSDLQRLLINNSIPIREVRFHEFPRKIKFSGYSDSVGEYTLSAYGSWIGKKIENIALDIIKEGDHNLQNIPTLVKIVRDYTLLYEKYTKEERTIRDLEGVDGIDLLLSLEDEKDPGALTPREEKPDKE
ncbi:hypothetical protein J4408_02765 [Candidatus Pacearchaeota archaeon]|nr:hypothetical protein [Candidatus Pacearchaeota archaeon]